MFVFSESEWAIPFNKHTSIRMTFIECLCGSANFEPCLRGSKSNFNEEKVGIFFTVSWGESITNYSVYREYFTSHGGTITNIIKDYLGGMIAVKLCPARD